MTLFECSTVRVIQIAALVVNISSSLAFTASVPVAHCRAHSRASRSSYCRRPSGMLRMNILGDIGDMLSGGKLEPQSSLPYGQPFCNDISCSEGVRTFAVRERPISFTGEDFDIAEITDGEQEFARVRGAMLHLPGKDKMRIRSSQDGEEVAVLDRVLVAATPSYDIYRRGNNAEKIGWIEKKLISLSHTFDVYMEGKGGFGVTGLFKPKAAYQISGDFIDRNFVMKNEKDEAVAKVKMDGLIQFDGWNHYQVQVAPGMDALLVIACCCAIDEEFDEEHEERRAKRRKEHGED